ncbi:hypothetical protein ADK86_14705 [Streptomyces sp. NRRL F-5755]|uniref:hypothetical protein n=1 Tax=Streptomyces sp. NRRL F-5755 TaxID=1519475 RepID=UPI0006AE9746|nr:hypothetical protein [Streptomyces sp. NRRL F-5755]KOT99981.1 hypothetical protein ADK86_14705 [Streptomyces sp. NRRL F-5755]
MGPPELMSWAFMLVVALTAAGVTAVYIHRFCAGTFRRATRPWAEGAFAAVRDRRRDRAAERRESPREA